VKFFHHTLRLNTQSLNPSGGSTSIIDLTPQLHALIAQANIQQGSITITSQHTTAAITINENEPRLLLDLQRFLARLVPPEAEYAHNDIEARGMPDEPRNAHAHIAAMLLGATTTLGITDGRLALGQYQSVLFVELDGPRARSIAVQISGIASAINAA